MCIFCLYLLLMHQRGSLLFPPQACIDIIHGYGKFTADPEPTIEVNGKKYTAPHILIATGGFPSVPPDSEVPGESLHSTSGAVKANDAAAGLWRAPLW